MNRVAVFVDVQNIYYTVKDKYNSHFDYGAFFQEVTTGRELAKAAAYVRWTPKFGQVAKRESRS